MKSFLFYDIETSGLNPAFDQVLTFAAIRTDPAFNELERKSITVRLRPDIVPSPKAFLTHGLTFDDLEKGICEYEAALEIHKIFNTPGTMSLGYNTLAFDDEFLRFMFYRNLLDPYSHQYANGCSRLDILPITVIFYLFKPEDLNWPEIDGKPSLKLENLSLENEFVTSGRAHEAMSDVESVIALSKIFYRSKKIWQYALDFFNKARDQVRIAGIENNFTVEDRSFKICLMLSISFGSDKNYMAPVIHLGNSNVYKNQNIWLRLDSPELIQGLEQDEADPSEFFVIRKKSADELIVLPALDRFRQKLPAQSLELYAASIALIKKHPDRFFRLIDYHTAFKYPYIPQMDADAALYQDGFFTGQEKKECQIFHRALMQNDTGLLFAIQSPRIKVLAERILSRNYPGLCKKAGWPAKISHQPLLRAGDAQKKIIGYKNDFKLDVQQGIEEINELKEALKPDEADKMRFLTELTNYIRQL